jgi:hypothetical protein
MATKLLRRRIGDFRVDRKHDPIQASAQFSSPSVQQRPPQSAGCESTTERKDEIGGAGSSPFPTNINELSRSKP